MASRLPGIKSKKREPLTLIFGFFIVAGILLTFTSFMMARDIVISDNGVETKVHTYSQTVEDVLKVAGLTLHHRDLVYPHLHEDLPRVGRIDITRAYPVYVKVDGEELDYWVTEGRVSDILRENGIILNELDEVTPALHVSTSPHMSIEITRIFKQQVTERAVLSHREVRQVNSSMDKGFSRVIKRGHDGLKEDTIEFTYADGVKTDKELVESVILRERQDRVVEEGTNTLLAARGGQTIRFVRAMYVNATAYCNGTPESGCPINELGHSRCTGRHTGATTSLGVDAIAGTGTAADPHIIAVDPRVIPYRTMVYIQGFGYAQALDTGGAIKGNRIDLLFPTHQEALRFGRRQLKIYILP